MSTPLMRVWAVNGTKSAWGSSCSSRPRNPYFSFASTTMLRPSGVSSARRRELRRLGHGFFGHAWRRNEFGGLAIAKRNRAGLIEQQHVDVARRFDRAPAHREDILLHKAIDASDTDRAEQAANCRWDKTDEQSDEHRDRRNQRSDRCRMLSST